MARKKNKRIDDPELDAILRKGPPKEEIIASAEEAPADLEALLIQLELVNRERSKWNEGKAGDQLYQELREQVTAELLTTGPRYFLDADGAKMVAVRQQSDPIEVNEELLKQLLPEVYERVAPPTVDATLFRKAVSGGDIPVDVFVKVAKFKPNRPFVKFIPAPDAD